MWKLMFIIKDPGLLFYMIKNDFACFDRVIVCV